MNELYQDGSPRGKFTSTSRFTCKVWPPSDPLTNVRNKGVTIQYEEDGLPLFSLGSSQGFFLTTPQGVMFVSAFAQLTVLCYTVTTSIAERAAQKPQTKYIS